MSGSRTNSTTMPASRQNTNFISLTRQWIRVMIDAPTVGLKAELTAGTQMGSLAIQTWRAQALESTDNHAA